MRFLFLTKLALHLCCSVEASDYALSALKYYDKDMYAWDSQIGKYKHKRGGYAKIMGVPRRWKCGGSSDEEILKNKADYWPGCGHTRNGPHTFRCIKCKWINYTVFKNGLCHKSEWAPCAAGLVPMPGNMKMICRYPGPPKEAVGPRRFRSDRGPSGRHRAPESGRRQQYGRESNRSPSRSSGQRQKNNDSGPGYWTCAYCGKLNELWVWETNCGKVTKCRGRDGCGRPKKVWMVHIPSTLRGEELIPFADQAQN